MSGLQASKTGRGGSTGKPADDPRWRQIHQAIEVIAGADGSRAERVQLVFSLPYSENWRHEYGA